VTETSTHLEVRGVTVRFGGRTVLDRVGLAVNAGEIVALLGPSGSGKSTLLRVVAGLLTPEAGHVLLAGRELDGVAPHERRFGYVFQDDQLFPHRDVAGNVAFGLRMRRVPRAQVAPRVAEVLHLVGLDGFDRRRVTDLSGGEAKRVALARALAPDPAVLLLDEPLTGLDGELHERLVRDLRTVLDRAGATGILVTHDLDEADRIADRVVRLDELSGA
jgi:thiamine transport system ATP-binding protein